MKVMVLLDVNDALFLPKESVTADEAAEYRDEAERTLIDGLTSVDMEYAIAKCLNDWYFEAEEGDVTFYDARLVEKAKNGRKNLAFHISRHGAIVQDN